MLAERNGTTPRNNAFEATFNNTIASQREQAAEPVRTQPRQERVQRQQAERQENSQQERAVTSQRENAQTEVSATNENEIAREEVVESNEAETAINYEASQVEEAILEYDYTQLAVAVAEVLQAEVEVVKEKLEVQNITAKELQEIPAQTELLKAVYEMKDTAELLKVDQITQVLEQLHEVATNEVMKSVEVQSTVSNMTVNVEQQKTADAQIPTEAVENILTPLTDKVEKTTNVDTNLVNGEQGAATTATATNSQIETLVQNALDPLQIVAPVAPTTIITAEGDIAVTTQGITGAAKAVAKVAQATVPATPAEIVEQIQGKIKTDIRGVATEIKMLLKPEALGEITLKILTQNGIISAQFTAENQRIKEIIETHLNDLKESLQQQGIEVSELSVNVSSEGSEMMDNFMREQEKSSQRVSNIINNIMEEENEEEVEQIILEEGATVSFTA
jgi:flagellar hook-length control protein FliK